jgi:uncharacterized protein YndB with AHSA1/START domain
MSMSTQTTTPPVRKTVTVKQPVDAAFALFTGRIADWWPRTGYPGAAGEATLPGTVVLEPRPQGRIYQRRPDGVLDFWGEVTVWEPPHRLVLAWRPTAGAPTLTEVEIAFIAEADGTRVELEHRGWEKVGVTGAATRDHYESGWEDVLRLYAAAGRDNSPAIVALILGITGIVLPLLGLIAAPFAIAFGIAGRRRAREGSAQSGMATAGLTLGAIALVLWGAILALGAGVVVSTYSDGAEEQVPVEPAVEPTR